MGKTITLQPVTRIEGHARIVIQLDDAGNVADTKMHVQSLRGFEKFCIGRPLEEMPRIATRICGLCCWAHHLAASKACDAIFEVEIPETARKLRRLMQNLAYIADKIWSFFYLAAPDFIMGPHAHYSKRNIFGILEQEPDIAKKAAHMRYICHMMIEHSVGRAIHPVAAVPGGFSKPMMEEERKELLSGAKELLEFCKLSLEYAKKNVFTKYEDLIKNLGTINTGFLGMVNDDGTLDFYDGKLRLMKPDGSNHEFGYQEYADHIAQHIEPWTYQRFPYAKKWGGFSINLENPVSIYRTNTLARINVCEKMATPLAQAELEEFRSKFGRPAQYTLLYHYARLIEMLQCAEQAVELLEDPKITGTDIRVKVEPKAGHAVGCVEDPRGTLIHDYEVDANGMITNVDIITGTTHNNAGINMSIKQAAITLIKNGQYDEGILNKIEMAIRAYDPCLSCATM
ncbi:MAG TPA: Ni/Fe hydrogenase subunit alpha [Syntrophaceae bacterium]|nr:Ni/Fe hydrogenase subunit alpha [Syntrophaceae bacterium]